MLHAFVIAESSQFAMSIERYLQDTHGLEVSTFAVPSSPPPRPESNAWLLQVFRHIADGIEHTLTTDSVDSIAIAEVCDPTIQRLEDLDPLDTDRPKAALLAMLILAFPEIHWVFAAPPKATQSSWFRCVHVMDIDGDFGAILRLHMQEFTPLFDPTGLRDLIRRRIRMHRNAPRVPLRAHVALALDDEKAYAYFHGYASYRFGFRSQIVSSHGLLRHLFGSAADKQREMRVAFEDVFLNFPDRDPLDAQSLSSLRSRDKLFPALAATPMRTFVTGGHNRTSSPQRKRDDAEYRDQLVRSGCRNTVLYKPCSGIFDLWRSSGVSDDLKREHLRTTDSNWLSHLRHAWSHRGQLMKAQGYVWPSAEEDDESSHLPEEGHSSPGRLLEVADWLIRRSERLLEIASTVPQAVRGALLALEAQELLGNQTPTTSLEALSLKQQFEVMAECMFYGVQREFDVHRRMKDIEKEVSAIGRWFSPRIQSQAQVSARRGIIDNLILRFRQFNQFDEEHACLNEARALWCRARSPIVRVPLRYVTLLVSSFKWFIVSTLFWVAWFGILFYGINDASGGLWRWQLYSAITFFGLGIPDSSSIIRVGTLPSSMILAIVAEIVLGFSHLGMLVSHLYSRFARR
jgi:hypothetical protein